MNRNEYEREIVLFAGYPKPPKPKCSITGDWEFTGYFQGFAFPYMISFNQTPEGKVTGEGFSVDNQTDTISVNKGYVSGNDIRLTTGFNSGGYIGTQVNTGKLDCENKTMNGVWAHLGGMGLRGTWSAIKIIN